MKAISVRMVVIALFIIIGSLSSSAQVGRGGNCLRRSTPAFEKPATCCVSTLLTDEQKTILNDLYVEFQAEMAELRSAMRSAASFADKLVIRQQMIDLRNEHIAEVKALLEEWGY